MAKKQQAPTNIQNKFNKPQFSIGDAVYFIWLGQKKYGYVKRIKETNWGLQYTVETNNDTRYPCGIAIGEHRTDYYTGCILFNETRELGTEEITRRITESSNSRRIEPILANPTRTKSESPIHDGHDRSVNDKPKRKKSKTGKRANSGKNADQPSSNGVHTTAKPSRKGSATLEDAIEKQRNFLNGFVKKD